MGRSSSKSAESFGSLEDLDLGVTNLFEAAFFLAGGVFSSTDMLSSEEEPSSDDEDEEPESFCFFFPFLLMVRLVIK